MGFSDLFDEALPLNRKERFFTGTVFPMIIAGSGMQHVGRFLLLVGVGERPISDDPDTTNIQLFTEYGFRESVFTDQDRERFDGFEAFAKDTPDVLIYLSDDPAVLISVEAKMYDVPTAQELREQMRRQEELCDFIATRIGDPEVVQAALIPEQLTHGIGDSRFPLVTWQQLRDAYTDVAPAYWVSMLDEALQRYDDLKSTFSPTGSNAEEKLAGRVLVERYQAGTLEYPWMGRQGGRTGAAVNEDISTGAWRDRLHECRSKPIESSNWFEVADFVRRLVELEGTTAINTTAS